MAGQLKPSEAPPIRTARTPASRIAQARKHRGLTQNDIAKEFGITSQAVSQWEKEDGTRPDNAKVSKLANLLEVEADWLLSGKGNIDDRRGEAGSTGALKCNRLPLINFDQVDEWAEAIQTNEYFRAEEYLLTDCVISDAAFALEIHGNSMVPDFSDGDRIIIDPAVEPSPGKLVVAKIVSEEKAAFRKYRDVGVDSKGQRIVDLVPLNPDWPTLRIDSDNPGRIIGTLVEHRRYHR